MEDEDDLLFCPDGDALRNKKIARLGYYRKPVPYGRPHYIAHEQHKSISHDI